LDRCLYCASANWHTTESDASSIDVPLHDETIAERIAALQDIIPASYRRSLASKFTTTKSVFKTGLSWGGKTLWVVSTSALLLAVPWALAYSEEQMMLEQEREMQMQARANEFLTPGAQPQGQQGAKPAL
jgi:import receptor subunit TOM22